MLYETKVVDEQVEPGALIKLLQKALKYIEVSAHVRDVWDKNPNSFSRMVQRWNVLLLSPLFNHINVFLEEKNNVFYYSCSSIEINNSGW